MTPKKSSLTRMADREFRQLVLARDEGKCRRCGRSEPLEAAHFVPRARRRTRWELDNAAALCVRECHRYLDTHPLEKEQWVVSQIGEERYRELRRLAENGERVDTREELERLREMRRTL